MPGYAGLEIAQKTRALDLTMPETPTDPFDGRGEASTGLTLGLRRIGPVHGRLCDVLNPHREMEPVEHVIGWPGTGGFAKGLRAPSAPSLRMVTGVIGVAPSP